MKIYLRTLLWIAVILTVSATLLFQTTSSAAEPLDEKRIRAVAAMLPEKPKALGEPITNRAAWDKLAKEGMLRDVVSEAEGLLKKPIAELPGDLYLDFSKTGNRSRWQRVAGRRDGRVETFVLAECAENKGRFIPALEKIVRALCDEPTWVMPAHDRGLGNFKGTLSQIDLRSSRMAWELATARALLGDKLSPATSRLILENVRRRVLDPFKRTVEGEEKMNWWTTGTNNWNSVCLAGVTGAALAAVESPRERAYYIVASEKYSEYFLKGFTADGYCSEGVGYWNYGFGNYLYLTEMIHQATDGRIDLLGNEKARQAALFGTQIEIVHGVSPAFADCSVSTQPSGLLMHYISKRLGLGLRRWEAQGDLTRARGLTSTLLFAFPNSASLAPAAPAASDALPLRTWFDEAGILISRPAQGSPCRLAVALKGGHNNEHHNHNDVGSYVAVVGDETLLVDPGAEVYTARTFSSKRYDSKVLNSFGHPVPLVAGKLQSKGSKALGRVIRTDFTDGADTLDLDIRSAYDVKGLEKLQRTFDYSRQGEGILKITDRVVFSTPQTFGGALITFSNWKSLGPNSLLIEGANEALTVRFETSGGPLDIHVEKIKEDVKSKTLPTRIGYNLKKPAKEATIVTIIAPVPKTK